MFRIEDRRDAGPTSHRKREWGRRARDVSLVSGASFLQLDLSGLTPAARHGRRISSAPGHVDPSVHNVMA